MQEETPKSTLDLQRAEKSRLYKEYYEANRERILKNRRRKKQDKNFEFCEKNSIPTILADHIKPVQNGTVLLRFQTVKELADILHCVKYDLGGTDEIVKDEEL